MCLNLLHLIYEEGKVILAFGFRVLRRSAVFNQLHVVQFPYYPKKVRILFRNRHSIIVFARQSTPPQPNLGIHINIRNSSMPVSSRSSPNFMSSHRNLIRICFSHAWLRIALRHNSRCATKQMRLPRFVMLLQW